MELKFPMVLCHLKLCLTCTFDKSVTLLQQIKFYHALANLCTTTEQKSSQFFPNDEAALYN